MDLVGFDEEPFRAIEADFAELCRKALDRARSPRSRSRRAPATTSRCRARARRTIPARCCSTTSRRSRRKAAPVGRRPFRMPVQWVCRPNARFPRFCGADLLRPRLRLATRSWSRRRAAPAASLASSSASEERDTVAAGQSAMLTLADEVDVSRGDLFRRARAPARSSPTSSPPTSCGWIPSRCSPAGSIS